MNRHDKTVLHYYSRTSVQLGLEPRYAHGVPERRSELAEIAGEVSQLLEGRQVLELGCGFGYWTKRLAEIVKRVVAIDISDEAIKEARCHISSDRVTFSKADVLVDRLPSKNIDSVLAAFLVSHIRRSDLAAFFSNLGSQLLPCTKLLVIDNHFRRTTDRRHPVTELEGDDYEMRMLRDGSCHPVRKNHFSNEELLAALSGNFAEVRLRRLDHFFTLYCKSL